MNEVFEPGAIDGTIEAVDGEGNREAPPETEAAGSKIETFRAIMGVTVEGEPLTELLPLGSYNG